MNLSKAQIAVLQAKYCDHCDDLRFRTGLEYKILAGFVTLNVVLGAWLTKAPSLPKDSPGKIGFMVFVVGIAFATIMMLHDINRTRKKVIKILHNINEALEFDKDGSYGISGCINVKGYTRAGQNDRGTRTKFWFGYQAFVVVLFVLAHAFVIFF